jgi:hypothetical protein
MYPFTRPALAFVFALLVAFALAFAFAFVFAFAFAVALAFVFAVVFAVACSFVCHPVGICFCLCCCLFSHLPPRQRHLSTALDGETVQRAEEKPVLSIVEEPSHLAFCSLLLFLLLGTPRLQPWVSQKTCRTAASTLPKAGVEPEGRNDPSIALSLLLSLLVLAANHQKTQQKPVSSPKPSNSMQTKYIPVAYELSHSAIIEIERKTEAPATAGAFHLNQERNLETT